MEFAFIGGLGHWELLIILIIALLIFGSRLPTVMRSLGRSVNEFKHGMSEAVELDDEPKAKDEPKPKDEASV